MFAKRFQIGPNWAKFPVRTSPSKGWTQSNGGTEQSGRMKGGGGEEEDEGGGASVSSSRRRRGSESERVCTPLPPVLASNGSVRFWIGTDCVCTGPVANRYYRVDRNCKPWGDYENFIKKIRRYLNSLGCIKGFALYIILSREYHN